VAESLYLLPLFPAILYKMNILKSQKHFIAANVTGTRLVLTKVIALNVSSPQRNI